MRLFPAPPSHGRYSTGTIAEPGLFVPLHIYPAPQHVDSLSRCGQALDAILVALADDLCRILHPNFGEFPFHALR